MFLEWIDGDRKCFVATAASPAPQNCRTRCVFGVPPAPKTFHQAQPDTLISYVRNFAFLFRSRAGFAKCWRLYSHPLDVAMQDRADAAKWRHLRHLPRKQNVFSWACSWLSEPLPPRKARCSTPHDRTVNCAPVHRYRWGSASLLSSSQDFSR